MKLYEAMDLIKPDTNILLYEGEQQSLAMRTLEEILEYSMWAKKEINFIAPLNHHCLAIHLK